MSPDTVLAVQSIYYAFTGLWPLFHIQSFLNITGPKTDLWLVKTVGLLITCIAGAQAFALISGLSASVIFLSVASCVALSSIDLYYALRGTIAKIYLIDAVAEAILLLGWALSLIYSAGES